MHRSGSWYNVWLNTHHMPNVQEIWDRIEEAKREQKEIRSVYKDMLASSAEYQTLGDDLAALKARKKQLEQGMKDQMSDKWRKVETLQRSIVDDRQLLADAALRDLLAGQAVKVVGAKSEEYEPLFTVRFQKKQ